MYVSVLSALMDTLPSLAVAEVSDKLSASASESLSNTLIITTAYSSTVTLSSFATGASLTAITSTVTTAAAVSSPSDTV